MDVVHKLDALDGFEDAAFAADGFADEEGFGLGMVEAGGVELDKFHVGDGHACAVGHGDAVTGSDVWVGGIEVDFSAAASGQDGDSSGKGFDDA